MTARRTGAGAPVPDPPPPAPDEVCERCGAVLGMDAFACTACGLPVVPRMTAAWKRAPRDARRTAAATDPYGARGEVRTAIQFGPGTLQSSGMRAVLAATAHLLGIGGLLGLALGAFLLGRLGS